MDEKIITALDIAQRDGCGSVKEWITKVSRMPRFMRLLKESPYTGRTKGKPVQAIIDNGRLLAVCECGGAEYVDPEEHIFYCFSCGNRANGGNARPVKFGKDEK